jgi:hypothetical protein
VHINIEGGSFFARWKGAYGVVDVGTDHEAVTTAICTMVDGNDVAGLFIVRLCCVCVCGGQRQRRNESMNRGIICVRSFVRRVSDRCV